MRLPHPNENAHHYFYISRDNGFRPCGSGKGLTIEESIAIGLENSKQLHSSQMKLQYADAKAREASAGLYPSLKAQASYQKLSDVPEFKIALPGFRSH